MLRRSRFSIVVLWTLVATLLLCDNAMAYIGPGAGMEFFGYAIALIGMIGAAFLSVIMWPVYTVLGWWRKSKNRATSEETAVASPAPVPPSPLNDEPSISPPSAS